MSKKRVTKKSRRLVQRSLFGGFVRPRTDEAVQRDVMAAADHGDYERLPNEIVSRLAVKEVNVSGLDVEDWPYSAKPVTVTNNTLTEMMRRAMAAGFVAALVKYRNELAAVPALSRFYSRQTKGQRRGRESQSNRKQTRSAEAKALARAGKSITDIVSHFRDNGMPKCDRSTVYRWLKVKTPRPR
jgi:hypothetical protein